MSKTQFSQEQLLLFLAKTISIIEGRRYTYRDVNLCSKHSLLIKNEVVVGHMGIIADEDYWQLIDQSFLHSLNYTEYQYREKAQSPKRALFLKHTFDNGGSKNKYKNMPNNNTATKIGSNIDDFPYLLEAITRLNNNAEKANRYDNEIINETLKEIERETKSYQAKDSTINATKELVKKLNEANLYRLYDTDVSYFRSIWYD